MRVTIPHPRPDGGPTPDACAQLEAGNILFLPDAPVVPAADARAFLLGLAGAVARAHKNIAYAPSDDRVTGLSRHRKSDAPLLRAILRAHATRVAHLATALFPPYAPWLRADYTSFRPEDEAARGLRTRSRNDLLHTDAFPSRPTHGDRILRVFTNINPNQARRWMTTGGFEDVLKRLANTSGLRLPPAPHAPWQRARRIFRRRAGARVPMLQRSSYDDFMLRLHDRLKADAEFQRQCPKQTWDFPPDSTWIVFTDMVPHAVLSGQYALEQTFILSRAALVTPEQAPINILERLCGGPLT